MSHVLSLPTILTAASVSLAADQPRTNLVAIVTDDQAVWTMGCYGYNEVQTPNMDRLAREGARFANAFTVTPVCSPSRTSYMTGRHGIEVGITDYIDPLETGPNAPYGPSEFQLGDNCQGNGYQYPESSPSKG